MLIDGRTGKPFGGPLPLDKLKPDEVLVDWTADAVYVARKCGRCGGSRYWLAAPGTEFEKSVNCWDCNLGWVYEWRKA